MQTGRKLNAIRASIFTLFASAYANAGYDIQAPTTGPFIKLGNWFQDYIDFMDGPFGTMVVVLSIVFGIIAWNFAPKEGFMEKALKGVVSGIVLLNIGTWMGSL